MTRFIDLPPSRKDETRVYWLLVVSGPLMQREIRRVTNWTPHRTNETLYRLRLAGLCRLIERGRHYQRHVDGPGANRCGRWQAITEVEVRDEIVDAQVVCA
jgi:hypothetical protein